MKITGSSHVATAAFMAAMSNLPTVSVGARKEIDWFGDRQEPLRASEDSKIGRNDPCPCGSSRKFKKCCMRTNKPERTQP